MSQTSRRQIQFHGNFRLEAINLIIQTLQTYPVILHHVVQTLADLCRRRAYVASFLPFHVLVTSPDPGPHPLNPIVIISSEEFEFKSSI